MAGTELVFDAEPLIAYYWDEPGADVVDDRLAAVEQGDVSGVVNTVTCTEVAYVVGRDDPEQATAYVTRLRNWFTVVDAKTVWEAAARYKRDHSVALGDAYTLATAETRDAVALVGGDDDYDDVTGVDVERIRDGGVGP